jgi:two-component sensor histidine kinase
MPGTIEISEGATGELRSRQRLLKETTALQALLGASDRLWQTQDLETGLREVLKGAIALVSADKGNIQLLDPTRKVLTIAAQVGFAQPFLDFFQEVEADEDCACGRALRNRERVIITDVEADPAFAPFREIARISGFRAVQSTPLFRSDGTPLGMLSTHFARPRVPDPEELALLDLYVRQAAAFIERIRQEDHIRLLSRELSHRCKNILSLVEVMARRSLPPEIARRFFHRLHALAASHDLLTGKDGKGVTIAEVVRCQMRDLFDPGGDRINVDGAAVLLLPDEAQALGIAVHELLTNAAKYGALSTDGGHVSVAWRRERTGDGASRIIMTWIESGGPPVMAPAKAGFGTLMLERMIKSALGGQVSMDFAREGFSWMAVWEQVQRRSNDISSRP